MLTFSKDILLRVVRRQSTEPAEAWRVIGIDDWAYRHNHRYGPIVCNLERRLVVALLPDRERATAQAWLALRPQIEIVATDHGGAYSESVALPHAVQVADRWHLMENAGRAFRSGVRSAQRRLIQTAHLRRTTAYEGYLQRKDANAAVMAQAREGTPIKQIFRRQERLERVPTSAEDVASAPTNDLSDGPAAQARARRAEQASDKQLQRVPSARTIAQTMIV